MPFSVKKMHRAYKAKYNEYYTTKEHMELLFTYKELNEVFRDKIVYLPCDSEESEILKYLTAHKEELGIKEILYTSDDYYEHRDLYEKADIVFTNPPFTGLHKYIKFIEDELNKKFILFASYMTVYYNNWFWDRHLILNDWKIISNGFFERTPYNSPKGRLKVPTFVFTNIESLNNVRRFRQDKEIEKQKSLNYLLLNKKDKCYFREDGVLFVKNSFFIPNDYYDEISVHPMCFMTYRHCFDFIRKDDKDERYIIKRKDK